MTEHMGFAEFAAARRVPKLRFAMVLTGDSHQAQDLVAAVFGRATHHRPQATPEETTHGH